MQNILRILRYVAFGLIVICNAIMTSVAVWNQSMGAAYRSVFSVDVYIICLGALELAFIFFVLFLELAERDSLTGTVWFECIWTIVSFVMNSAGASALSAIIPKQLCSLNSNSATDACNSTRTLLAFSWIVTLILLMYSISLISSVLLLQGEHPTVWSLLVRHLPSPSPKSVLSSEPPSPVLPRFPSIRRPPAIVAPIPRLVISIPEGLYPHGSGLGLDYTIERYRLNDPPMRPIGGLELAHGQYPSSLYPQPVHSALHIVPETPVFNSASRFGVPNTQDGSSPPPLGDWPRPDVLTQPVRSKRTKHSNASLTTATHDYGNVGASRPSGPRKMPAAGAIG